MLGFFPYFWSGIIKIPDNSMWIAIAMILALLCVVLLVWLRRQQGDLRQERRSGRMNRAFLQNISHEISTPLKSVKELAAIVAKEDLYLSKSEKRNISEQMQYNADLISTLLDEMMLFSDCGDGHQLSDESFSPNALCRRCLEANMFSIYHQQAVKLNFKRELNDEFFVKSDRHIVELIVNKLILNACRFTEQGEITVGCNTSEEIERLTIYVQDTGAGIPSERMNSLFNWFDEPDDMRDEAELDLSIVQRLAQKLGGDLRLDDSYTGGTRVLLVLPLK